MNRIGSILTIPRDELPAVNAVLVRGSGLASGKLVVCCVDSCQHRLLTDIPLRLNFQILNSEVFSYAILRFMLTMFLRQIVPYPGLDGFHARSGISQWQMIQLTVSGRRFPAPKNRARARIPCNILSRIGPAFHATPGSNWPWPKSSSEITFLIPSAFQTSPMPPALISAPCNACSASTVALRQYKSC